MKKSTPELSIPQLPFSIIEAKIRGRIREVIEACLAEEVDAALGAGSYERTDGRRGYRHGHKPARTVVTGFGVTEVTQPRARLRTPDGHEEFEGQLLGRYERRTKDVDAAILSCYLSGANTRKIRLALRPLFKGTAMSKSVVSRVVKRLREHFEAWRGRDLSDERYVMLIADAMRLPVRLARRVVKVPVQAVLGVREDGEKELLELRIAPSESLKAWQGVMEHLAGRGLPSPIVVVIDGNKGLIGAVRRVWPEAMIQRCTKHKLENLKSAAPVHAHDELKRDYHAIVNAADLDEARNAYRSFVRKWEKLVPEVARSLEEGGEELLTFYQFPRPHWKTLRTTNMIERLNGEFRRRTKTQGSFPNEESALVLLYGLLATQMIRLRKIDGYQKMQEVIGKFSQRAA
jgi:transposase-like protein